MSNQNETELMKVGLDRAIEHLEKYENISADELMQILGVMTNDSKFAGLVHSLWKMLISEVRQRLHDDIANLDEEMQAK